MKLSYLDLLGDGKRHKIKAEVTTEHSASHYGIPVIVLDNGGVLDLQSWVMLNYIVEEATEKETGLIQQVFSNFNAMMGLPNLDKLLNSIQIRKLLGGISKQSFWNLKSRKGFPSPAYSENGIELWKKEDIEKYIETRKEK